MCWNTTCERGTKPFFWFLILSHRLVASLILQPPPCCLVDSSTTALLPLLFCIRKRFVFNIYDLHKFKSVNRKKRGPRKNRSSYKNGLGRITGKQIDENKGWHLEWDGKHGKQRIPRKNGHLTKMDWEKKWEANRCQKRNWHLEGDGKNGKQIEKKKRRHLKWDGKTGKQRTPSKKRSSYKHGLGRKNGKHIDPKKKGGILNRTEKMGSKELQEKRVI